jgi:small conductance mechanosensitive channel
MDPETMQGGVEEAIETAVELISNWGLQVLGAITLLIIGRWAAALVRGWTRRALDRSQIDASLAPFFSSLAYYLVLVVVGIAVLQLFGIETTSLVAVVGAASLAIGLALQGTLSNFAAGVMLLMFRPFKLGDYVEVGGSAGGVQEIGIFTTTLNTPDNVMVMIPNASVYGEVIKNYSANATRRIDLVMGISYGDDIEKAIEIISSIVSADERVHAEPAPTIAVAELGDNSVNLVVRPWCEGSDYWPLRFDLTRALKEGLEAGGCSIPYPQRDVHVIAMPTAGSA